MLARANEHRKETSAAATTAAHVPVRRSPPGCMRACMQIAGSTQASSQKPMLIKTNSHAACMPLPLNTPKPL